MANFDWINWFVFPPPHPGGHYSGNAVLLGKAVDKCSVVNNVGVGSYKVGPTTYDSIVVCENGYLFPHISGNPIPTKWVDGNDFDSPSATMIAVALINNTRLDNWMERGGCNANYEPICDVLQQASNRFDTLSSVEIYSFKPLYGANAEKANFIRDWIAAGNNTMSSYYIFEFVSYFDESMRHFIFSHTVNESFVTLLLNNVISRACLSKDFAIVTSLITDGFAPTWGTVVSWYKVAQPPEVVDKQNTFQFVICCQTTPTSRCVTLFDYFDLMYIENDGDGNYVRAGINGPSIGIYLFIISQLTTSN